MADPTYIDSEDGSLTDPEAWVYIASATVSTTGVSSVALTSSTGTANWSQYLDLVVIAHFQHNFSGASGIWGPMKLKANDVASSGSYNTLRWFTVGSSVQGGVDKTSGFLPLGYHSDDSATGGTGSAFFSGMHLTIYDINSGKGKPVISIAAAEVGENTGAGSQNGYINNNYGIILIQDALNKLEFSTSGDWGVGSQWDLYGVLPKMVNI